jgi:hypothetical protein
MNSSKFYSYGKRATKQFQDLIAILQMLQTVHTCNSIPLAIVPWQDSKEALDVFRLPSIAKDGGMVTNLVVSMNFTDNLDLHGCLILALKKCLYPLN